MADHMSRLRGFEETIEQERTRSGVPGAAIGVVAGEGLIFAAGSGTSRAGSDIPVTENTLFAVGSCTKAMTACTLATLVDEGRLDWDRPVREYLPWFELADPVASAQATLVDLLSHRTGLPRHDFVWVDQFDKSRASVIEQLRFLEPSAGFRQVWQYNNLMYLVAGYIAGVKGEGSWEDTIGSRLLGPLGMTKTRLSVRLMPQSPDYSLPHREIGGEATVIGYRNLDLMAPVGGVNSCVSDMAKWLALTIGRGSANGHRLVSERTACRMREPAMPIAMETERTEHPDVWPETRSTGYGLGWFLGHYRQHSLVMHAGNIDGFSATVSLLPEYDVGTIVLANMDETLLPTVLTYSALDRLLGLPALPWGERYQALRSARGAGLADVLQRRELTMVAGAAPLHPLGDYEGAYHNPGYGDFTVRARDGLLHADLHGLKLALRHRHYDIWDASVDLSPLGMPVSFQTGYGGGVEAVAVVVEPALDAIVFRRRATATVSTLDQDRLVGVYQSGPLTLRVSAAVDGQLAVECTGRPLYLLHPDVNQELRYRMGSLSNTWMDVVLGPDSRAQSLIIDPWGSFARVEEMT